MKKLLPVLFILFGIHSIKASHVAGCDFTYTYIGNQKYVIYIDFYRDCRSIALSSSQFTYYHRFQASSGSFQQYVPSTQSKLISITEVSNICKNDIPFCSKVNTSGQGYGLERHRYTDTVDLTNSSVNENVYFKMYSNGGAYNNGKTQH